MSRATADDQLKFLLSCVKYSNNGKIDFVEVAQECGIVSKGAAAKRYERLMKANGIHPSCDKPASPSTPKEKSKASIAKSAAAKRRKIEGDAYDTKQDDEDEEEMKPMILKNERIEDDLYRQIKSEPDTEFREPAYPQIPIPPSPSYFSHLSQPIMQHPGFLHIPSQAPIHQYLHHPPTGSSTNQQFRYHPNPNMLPIRPQYQIPSAPLSSPFSSGKSTEPESHSSWLNDFYNEDFTKESTNFEVASNVLPITKTEGEREELRPRSIISSPSVTLPPQSQELALKTDQLSSEQGRSSQDFLKEASMLPSGNSTIAGQGVENSILITD